MSSSVLQNLLGILPQRSEPPHSMGLPFHQVGQSALQAASAIVQFRFVVRMAVRPPPVALGPSVEAFVAAPLRLAVSVPAAAQASLAAAPMDIPLGVPLACKAPLAIHVATLTAIASGVLKRQVAPDVLTAAFLTEGVASRRYSLP